MCKRITTLLLIVFLLQLTTAKDTEVLREQIPAKYKWNLSDLYSSNDAWEKDKQKLETMLEKFDHFKGKLGQSVDMLFNCLNYSSDVWKKYNLLSGYANKLSDQDTRESAPLAMAQAIEQVGTQIATVSSFIDPEILAIDKTTIEKFMAEKPELKEFAQYIDDVQRLKAHTLSQKEEAVIAAAGRMAGTPYDVYGIFKNADMPRPTLSLEEGKQVSLDDANYTLYRADNDRQMRKEVFEKFFGAYKAFERTFGTQLYSQLKKDIFYKNVRQYDSCLESALNANNIPPLVYTSLIDGVHKNLPTLHRYLNLRKRMLGLDELHYYDMYPSLVKKVEMRYNRWAAIILPL
jgi:oligoendopeptidase F